MSSASSSLYLDADKLPQVIVSFNPYGGVQLSVNIPSAHLTVFGNAENMRLIANQINAALALMAEAKEMEGESDDELEDA